MSTNQVLAYEEGLFKKWHGAAGGRLRFAYGFGREPEVSPNLFKGIKRLADRDGTIMNMHIAVTPQRVQWFKNRYGLTTVEFLDSLGVLGPNWLFVHAVALSDKEVDICARRDVKISHAPGASVHGTYGAASQGKFPEMLKKGVVISLSTDSAVADNTFDMFRIMYLAATLHKEIRMIPDLILPEQALEMATVNGARALKWEDQIGSLEKGKKADLIIVDTQRPNWRPLHDFNIINNLVYSADGNDVLTTIVNGEVLYENRRFKNVNLRRIMAQAQKASERLFRQHPPEGLGPRWPVI
jgi:5-methylthioadenosine/S-adenosylhomocysteine deaminase